MIQINNWAGVAFLAFAVLFFLAAPLWERRLERAIEAWSARRREPQRPLEIIGRPLLEISEDPDGYARNR